ncbi:MAG: hypothetical protein RL385_182 [Pseudomonadota bacterium]
MQTPRLVAQIKSAFLAKAHIAASAEEIRHALRDWRPTATTSINTHARSTRHGCLVPGPSSTCAATSECKQAACVSGSGCEERDRVSGTRCSAGVCDGAGHCVACQLNSDCSDGTICDLRDNTCRVPVCGDGAATKPDEPCDPSASGTGNDTWHCSPACKARTAYILCSSGGAECSAGYSCQATSQGRWMCMPESGLGLSGAGNPNAVCPMLPGYVQKLWSNAYCVVSCSTAKDCPAHLARCESSPFAGAGPNEAVSFCTPF